MSRQPEWPEVKEWVEDKIRVHETAVRQPGLEHTETETSRYIIKTLEALLKLAKPSKMQDEERSD